MLRHSKYKHRDESLCGSRYDRQKSQQTDLPLVGAELAEILHQIVIRHCG